jgi:primosomal protein N' (replication factor Y)
MTEKKTQFILRITPLVRVPLSRDQFFYYLADEKLPAGTLVSIPLFKKKVEGIVIESKNDFPRVGGMTLKKIEKVLEKNFLTKEQLTIAKYISDYYIVSLGIVLKNFVPKRTKARNTKQVMLGKIVEKNNLPEIVLTKEQMGAVKNISEKKHSPFLLLGPAGSGKTEVYIHSILELKKQNPENQFLILVPEKTLTPQALERYGAYFSEEEIVLLSSNLSRGAYFANWQRVKNGEAKIIIGTRMAVFAPFKKVALIVIDEEQDISFKQWEMNPRYDARTVAEKMSELRKCKLIRGSATPSVESFFKTKNDQYDLLTISDSYSPKNKTKVRSTIELVDMKKERWANLPARLPAGRQGRQGNYSCISKKLKNEIAYALKNNLQTILFINRQGMSTFSVCKNCKTVLRCPQCERALIYTNSGEYKCPHCTFIASVIPSCSKCQGIEFKNVGLGTQKVEKEVRDLFSSARILRLDSAGVKEKDFQKQAYEKFSKGLIDILIGTQMITKGWDLPKMALVSIIDADNMLTLPDFRVGEKAFQDLVQLSGRVSRPGARFPGRVIIQTYHPENKILNLVSKNDYQSFYDQELPDRQILHYPPFGKIAKLVFEDYNQKKAHNEAGRIYGLLDKEETALDISFPADCFVPKIRQKFRKQIILKYKNQLPEKILAILRSLPTGWTIDIDPISII